LLDAIDSLRRKPSCEGRDRKGDKFPNRGNPTDDGRAKECHDLSALGRFLRRPLTELDGPAMYNRHVLAFDNSRCL
jgi:hypothetical protein